MSIYDGSVTERHFPNEGLRADARDVYGLTKSLGEEVCRHAVRAWGMTVNVLRLCLPVSTERWYAGGNDCSLAHATAVDDVAAVLLAALEYRHGFETFMISGDRDHIHTNLSKARRLLKWEPRARPVTRPGTEARRTALDLLRGATRKIGLWELLSRASSGNRRGVLRNARRGRA